MITIAEIKHQEKLVGRHYGAIRRLSKPDSDKVLRQKAARRPVGSAHILDGRAVTICGKYHSMTSASTMSKK